MRIPDYNALGEVAPPRPSMEVASVPTSQVTAVGEATQRLGQQEEKTGTELQDLLDRTNTMQAINAFHQNAANIGNEFYSKNGAALAQAYPQYIKDLSDNAQQIYATLPTNQARQAFQAETQGHIAQEMYRAGIHAGDGIKQYNQDTFKAGQDIDMTKLSNAFQTGDTNAAAELIQNMHTGLEAHLIHDQGIPPGDPIIADQHNTLDAGIYKNLVDNINSLPVSDPRRVSFVSSRVQGGVQALMNWAQGAPSSPSPAPAAPQAFTPQQVSEAIIGHESGGNPNAPTSAKGAVGEAQILPATFDLYAKPGESIVNKADNMAVHNRIIADYMQRYNGDPARVAVAYISGTGNVAPAGSATPWIKDLNDGNENVSDYVANVQKRLGVSPTQQQSGGDPELVSTPAIHGLPVMADLDRKAVQAFKTDLSAAYRLQKDQQEMQDNQIMQQFEPLLAQNKLTTQQVESSNLSWEMKDKLRKEIQEPAKTDAAVFNDLVARTNLPDGALGKLTDPKELAGYIGKGITVENYNQIQKMMADPDELKTFFKQGHDQLSKSTMLNIDGEGEQRAYKWEMATRNLLKIGQEKGLSIHQMIDPSSKDYIGNNISQFQETLEQQAANLAGQTRSAALSSPLPTEKQRQPGETPDAFVKRLGL